VTPGGAPTGARRATPRERRRALALAAMWIAPALAVLAGAHQAWPLFCLPLVAAVPLAGTRGLVLTAAGSALVLAALTADPQLGGAELVIGFLAFLTAGAASGLTHRVGERRVETIARDSVTDRLTGLPNFAYFEDALGRECRRADRYGLPLSLAIIDLDRFKEFNDAFGHDAGNRMLAEVGAAILASLRSSDLAARFGGEELAILVQGTAREASEVAERIRLRVARIEVPVAGGRRAGTTLSAGVAEYVHGQGDGDLLLDQADKALYAAKEGGRDQVRVFEPEHRWSRAGVG
jgi:diguanylate cyclase (GGDEF)-like protein